MRMYSCGPFRDAIGLQNSQNTDVILHISIMWKADRYNQRVDAQKWSVSEVAAFRHLEAHKYL